MVSVMRITRSLSLILLSAAVLPMMATAQISVDELAPATAFDAGTLAVTSGGLDPAMWQGTSAAQAAALLEAIPVKPRSRAVADMIDTVLLTGATPPSGEDVDAFRFARKTAILRRGNFDAFDEILKRTPVSGSGTAGQAMRADRALLGGDSDAACLTADTITQGRTEPYWARLRAFCHAVRDEGPAAELTADLLTNAGYEDAAYFALLDAMTGRGSKSRAKSALKTAKADPLIAVMASRVLPEEADNIPLPAASAQIAKDSRAPAAIRFKALMAAGRAVNTADAKRVLLDLAVPDNAAADPNAGFFAQSFDFDSAVKETGAPAYGQLYSLTQAAGNPQQRAKSAAALLTLAQRDGHFDRIAELIADDVQQIPSQLRAVHGLDVFTRLAAGQGDTMALRELYIAMEGVTPEDPNFAKRDRLALASDAIGNGFILGPLGADIETRLAGEGAVRRRAVRDTYLAIAMGAVLSDNAITLLNAVPKSGISSGRDVAPNDLLILSAIAKRGSRAETALRTAQILGTDRPADLSNASLAAVIEALQSAGLQQFAGRLAAEDFLGL